MVRDSPVTKFIFAILLGTTAPRQPRLRRTPQDAMIFLRPAVGSGSFKRATQMGTRSARCSESRLTRLPTTTPVVRRASILSSNSLVKGELKTPALSVAERAGAGIYQ